MRKCPPFTCWTDYPFLELGDTPGRQAPIRQVLVLSYDGNKYAQLRLGTQYLEVKAGYLYRQKGRLGQVRQVSRRKLERMYA